MAWNAVNILNNFNTADDNFNTASGSPHSNWLQLLTISSRTTTSTDPNIPTVTGAGLTWELVDTIIYDTGGSSRKRVSLFRALGTASAGALTIDFAGQQQAANAWVWDEVDGADTGGTNGSAAIVQTDTVLDASGSATALSATLSAFGDSANATYANISMGNSSVTATPGSGFAQVGSALGSQTRTYTEFRNDNDTSPDWTFTAGGEVGIIAVELKAAGGVVAAPPPSDMAHTPQHQALMGM